MKQEFDPYSEWLGIPASEQPCDYYRLLGVSRFEECHDSISRAADERMAIVRQYQMGPKSSYTQTLLNELSAARLCLLNEATKATYDAVLQGASSTVPEADLQVSPPVGSVETPHLAPEPVGPPVSPPTVAGANAIVTPPPPPRAQMQSSASDEFESARQPLPVWLIAVVVVSLIAISGFVGWAVAMRARSVPAKTDTEIVVTPETPVTPPENTEDTDAFEPIVIMQEANGELNLMPATALLYGDHLQLGTARGKDILTNWKSTDDWVEWRIKVAKPSVFQAKVTYMADKSAVSAKYVLSVADATKVASVRRAEDGEFVTDEVFIAITSSGEHTLQFKAQGSFERFIDLMKVQLVPATGS